MNRHEVIELCPAVDERPLVSAVLPPKLVPSAYLVESAHLGLAVLHIAQQMEKGSLLRKALEEPVPDDGSGCFAYRGFIRPANGSRLYMEHAESTLNHAIDNISMHGIEKRPYQAIWFCQRDPRFALAYAIPFDGMLGFLIVSRETGMDATRYTPAELYDGATFKSLHVGTIVLSSS